MDDFLKTWGPLLAVAIGFLLALIREVAIHFYRRKRANNAVEQLVNDLKSILTLPTDPKSLSDFKDKDLRAKSAAAFGEKMSAFIYLNAANRQLAEFEKIIRLIYHYRDMSDKYLGEDEKLNLDTTARVEYHNLIRIVKGRFLLWLITPEGLEEMKASHRRILT